MQCDDRNVFPGADCAGEILFGNPFLVQSGIDVTYFLANNIDNLYFLDYGVLNREEHYFKMGKMGICIFTFRKNYTSEFTSRVCNLILNGYFLLKNGYVVDYKDLDIGEKDEEELTAAIDDAIERRLNRLSKRSKESFMKMVGEIKDAFRTRFGIDPLVDALPMVIKFISVLIPGNTKFYEREMR